MHSNPARPVSLELLPERAKAARVQRLAHFAHQVQVVVQVVHAGQHGAQHFAAAVEVVQIGPAEAASAALRPGGARAGCCRFR